MDSRRALERRLEELSGFAEPRLDLEQYPTPPDVAAHLVHLADLRGDLDGVVVDLGAGTGVLALAAASRDPALTVGIERDAAALDVALANERRLDPPGGVDWVRGDVASLPLRPDGATVVSNPPFGAQRGRTHADRPFLAAAAAISSVSYTIHNAGSRDFVEAFAADAGGRVTDAFAVRLDLPRQFDFHTHERTEIPAEAFRIEWDGTASGHDRAGGSNDEPQSPPR